MATRSRKGCIDCKQAKVKCDEVYPSCGTCARRRRQCSGYGLPQAVSRSRSSTSTALCRRSQVSSDSVSNRRSSVVSNASSHDSRPSGHGTETLWADLGEERRASLRFLDDQHAPSGICETTTNSVADYVRTMVLEASTKAPCPLRGLDPIPLNQILAADKPFIEVYFMRHPSEMVMSNDFFIHEMNGAVISLLQQNPTAVGDSLAAIGENYVKDTVDAAVVSNRKMRLVSRLRLINEDGSSPELVLLLLLALSGVELVDPWSDGRGDTLSALIENVSMILQFHTRSAKTLNHMAKYFARGVARQDLLISLSLMQRTKIEPSLWLDDYSMNHADRLMGLTATLAPILSELAALAEDVNSSMHGYLITEDALSLVGFDHAIAGYTELAMRERSIRAQLMAWRPVRDRSMSMNVSRKFLLHAYAWRAAALLYLFRLSNRPGSSIEADDEALSMAYEVIVHISGTPEDIKLSLWPLFIAGCELQIPEDRAHAVQLFDDIHYARPIVTTRQTKSFCVDQIWPARDSGEDWDWMRLAQLGIAALVPL